MKKIILATVLTSAFFACDDKMEELNTPRKNAAIVPAETLFANGTREMFDMIVSSNVNENNFRLYAQYWAQTTYPDESQYNMVTRNLPDNIFQNAYRDVLKDLSEAKRITEETWEQRGYSETEKNAQVALVEVLEAYTYTFLVDMFGATPFSEALNSDDLSPKYDAGQDVYNASIDMLNDAIGKLQTAVASEVEAFPADQDLVYGGDLSGWLQFANSLKLRLAITISDVDATKAQTMITEALTSGVISSNDYNATIAYLPALPNTNPLFEDLVQSGRHDYVIANTIVDVMTGPTGLNDPRIAVYADEVEGGGYIGGEYGTANNYLQNSHLGEIFHDPALEGVIMDYSETNFLLAEAAAKGLNAGGAVEDFYEAGIRASFEYSGVEGVDAYLAQPQVAYATAQNNGTWQQKIGIQEWLALYNRGVEGWNLWRRLDFTGFNVPDGLEETDIPRRLIFPIKEATLNPSELDAAIALIGGSNDVQTKVFWDVH